MDRIEYIKELRAKRAKAWESAKGYLDEARTAEGGLSGELLESYNRADSDVEALTNEIDANERALAHEYADRQVTDEREQKTGVPQEQRAEAFNKYMRQGNARLTSDEISLLERGSIAGGPTLAEFRDQQVADNTLGGYLVPEGFWNRVTEVLKAFGGIEGNVNTITTSTGNPLPWPTNDDTANTGAILTEGSTVTSQDVTFGLKNLDAFLYTSKLVKVSIQLLQDSAIDIEGFLARKLGMRLARIHNNHFTVGTGASQPDGIAVSPTTGKTAASATAVTHDEIIDLVHSIDPAYRTPEAKFMFADGTAAKLRKIVDGQGNKLWVPGLQPGQPDRISGYEYIINQDMPAMTTGNVSMLFGNFVEGYVVRKVRAAQLVRMGEKYMDSLQVGFFLFDRVDGTKDDLNAYKAMVQA